MLALKGRNEGLVYEIDAKDKVIELEGIPQSDPGAPLPLCVSNEEKALVAYILSELETGKDFGDEFIVLDFGSCLSTMFGSPNDEVLNGHPLYKRGLRHYGSWEVLNSSWLRSLIKVNSVHPQHNPEAFAGKRHFVMTFHDSTFECLSEGVKVLDFRGSKVEAIELMMNQLSDMGRTRIED